MDYPENVRILPFFALKNPRRLQELFDMNKKYLGVDYDFDFLTKSTHLYCACKNGEIISGIYYFNDLPLEDEIAEKFDIKTGGGGTMLFMNGFSKRKNFNENLFTIKKTAKFYRDEIFAYTDKKTAMYLLSAAGFERVEPKRKSDDKFRLFKLKNTHS